MPKPELKTYAVSVPITVHVTYYVKAESMEEACAVDVNLDELVFVDASGGIASETGVLLDFYDQVAWEEMEATEADPSKGDMCVARQDVGEDEG